MKRFLVFAGLASVDFVLGCFILAALATLISPNSAASPLGILSCVGFLLAIGAILNIVVWRRYRSAATQGRISNGAMPKSSPSTPARSPVPAGNPSPPKPLAATTRTKPSPPKPAPSVLSVKQSTAPAINVAREIPPPADRFVQVFPAPARAAAEGISISIAYETRDKRFFQDARKFRNKEESSAEPVPFFQYWPTYDSMSAAQKRWYFFWRAQVRRGNYLPTDLSYIFVHVYEVLNLIEFPEPLQATARLRALRDAYVQTHPKLDNYLPEWGGDLLAVKTGLSTAFEWWQPFVWQGILDSQQIANVVLEQQVRAGKTSEMPPALWLHLSNYRPRNKFYHQYNQEGRLDRAYVQAIQVADEYARRKKNQSLLESFTTSKPHRVQKYIFTSALIGYDFPPTIELGECRNYFGNSRLADHLAMVCKYAENILRKQMKASGRLSGIKLNPELMQMLDAAFAPRPELPKPVVISLDAARIADLHKESQQIGALLETDTGESQPSASKPLYSDVEEVRQLVRELDDAHRRVIASVYQKQLSTVDDLTRALAPDALLPNSALERINELALTLLGDRLIYLEDDSHLSLAEDFVDELDIVLQEPIPPLASRPDDSFEQLAARVTPVEIALLEAFAARSALSEGDIDALTRPHHVMGNVALDALNEKAADALGHPPFYFEAELWQAEADDLSALREHFSLGGQPNADSET